ncbi:12550_t:CDS:1 [Racocetra persica]|nr:12550_t:CDS:1 [Racocetra persica]
MLVAVREARKQKIEKKRAETKIDWEEIEAKVLGGNNGESSHRSVQETSEQAKNTRRKKISSSEVVIESPFGQLKKNVQEGWRNLVEKVMGKQENQAVQSQAAQIQIPPKRNQS